MTLDLAAFREAFPATRDRAYLFSGAIAPLAEPVRAALESWEDGWERLPLAGYDGALAELESLRAALARLLGADPDSVGVLPSTSAAINAAARLLPAGGRSTVVVDSSTYPSTRYAFAAAGRTLRHVDVEDPAAAVAALEPHVGEDTLAIAISHVAPLTGRRRDVAALAELAHAHGALLVVDTAQSLGVLPVDVGALGVDVLVGTTMKWLLGPPGIGVLYVRPELLEQAPLGEAGYLHAVVAGEDWPTEALPGWAAGVRHVELGMPPLGLLGATEAGVRLIEAVGVATIHERVEQLVGRLIDGLRARDVSVRTPSDPAWRAGVVGADVPDAPALAARLRERGVDVGGYPWGLLRVDPHAFCVPGDIDRFLDELDAYRAETPG